MSTNIDGDRVAPKGDGRYNVPCTCCNARPGELCQTLQHIPMNLIHKQRGDRYRREVRRLQKQREAIRRGY